MADRAVVPLRVRDIGGCTCGPDGHDFHVGDISPTCRYHQGAAEQPWNHFIPWNCPTYYDGCNCEGGPFYEPPTDCEDICMNECQGPCGV